MSIAIKVTMLADRSLLLQADNATRSELAQQLHEGYQRAEGDFLEMLRGNYSHKFKDGTTIHYSLEWLDPADIYALTDMPMFADTVRDDDDSVRVYGPVWGFPDYQIRDHITELAHRGRAILTVVADFGTEGVSFPSRFDRKTRPLADKLAVEAYQHCVDGGPEFERVPDPHGEPGDTIRRLVGFKADAPAPVIAPLL